MTRYVHSVHIHVMEYLICTCTEGVSLGSRLLRDGFSGDVTLEQYMSYGMAKMQKVSIPYKDGEL